MNDFKNSIVEKIKAGEISMQPRWHFVLRTTLLILSAVIVALIAIYLLSFVMFALHKTGVSQAPGLGMPGLRFFMVASPWFLISLIGLFLVTLYLLVTHYAFSYHRPLVYTMIGVVLVVMGAAAVIQQTTMHERLQVFSEQRNVPGMAPLYRRHAGERPEGITPGTVVELNDSGFVLETDDGERIAVLVTDETRQPRWAVLEVGMPVLVFGDRVDGTIHAFGVRPAMGAQNGGGRGPQSLHRGSNRMNQPASVTPTRD